MESSVLRELESSQRKGRNMTQAPASRTVQTKIRQKRSLSRSWVAVVRVDALIRVLLLVAPRSVRRVRGRSMQTANWDS